MGWTIKEDGSKLFCRETYVDGAAAGHHLSCVAKSGALGEALEKGYIALDNIDLMGTESDIADAKKVPEFEGFGLGSWTVWDSFQNFAGQDRVPRPEGGLADVQEKRRRARRHLLGPLRQLLQVQDVSFISHDATKRVRRSVRRHIDAHADVKSNA